MTTARPRAIATLLLAVGFGLGLGASACVLPNPNHCQNIALDADAWCASIDEDRPYCSPCEADNNGCVSEEPSEDECPEYSPQPSDESGTDTDTGTDTDDTDTDTDTGETGP